MKRCVTLCNFQFNGPGWFFLSFFSSLGSYNNGIVFDLVRSRVAFLIGFFFDDVNFEIIFTLSVPSSPSSSDFPSICQLWNRLPCPLIHSLVLFFFRKFYRILPRNTYKHEHRISNYDLKR